MLHTDYESLTGGGPPPVFPRYTLDNPILPYNRRFFINALKSIPQHAPAHIVREANAMKEFFKRHGHLSKLRLATNSEKCYPILFSPTLVTQYPVNKDLGNVTSITDCVTRFLISLQNAPNFPKWAKADNTEITKSREVLSNPLLKNLTYWSEQVINLRNLMATLQSNKDKKAYVTTLDHPVRLMTVYYTANFLILYTNPSDIEETGVLFDYDQICGISDTSTGRTLTIESALFHKAFNVQSMPKEETIIKLYIWGDRQLSMKGNDGYRVLKTYESIVRTLALRNEPYDYCRSFHKQCLNGLQDVLLDLGLSDVHYTDLVAILDRVEDIQSSEIAGLYRHWMHPTVDETSGMRKVKGIAKSDRNISSRLIMRIRAAFNRSFVQEYIAQNRRWPTSTMSHNTGGPLPGWVSRKALIFDESAPGYNWEHWAYLSFGKIFEFDFKIDVLDLLDDKACSLPKSQAHQIFYKKFSNLDWCTDKEQRRVLINILSQENFDTKAIIDKIVRRQIPEEWLTVGLHSKEREMKMEPRLFAILPPEVRAYFVLTEHNIAKYLFKYFPQQTMNLGADQLDRRLLQLALPKHSQDAAKKKFTANLDFKSWNIYWTKEAVESIFLQIGCMFGMPTLYTFTHEFFEKAMLYLSSYCCPPENWTGGPFKREQECDCHLWFGHNGGLEGLRQKGWTLVTIAMLELVRLETGIESIITGQGDNQVIIFFINEISEIGLTPEQIEKYYTAEIQKYIKTIHEIALGMGQQLKLEETWVSSRIVEYGKDLLMDGVFVSAVYKKISRALEVTNELAPGLQSQISHVFSVMQASCAKGFSWLPIYVQTLSICDRVFKGFLNFDQANPKRSPKKLNSTLYSHLLQLILFVPRSLGGLAALPFTEFILRGHPDPTTSGLVHLQMLEDQCEFIPPYVSALKEGKFFAEEVDFLMLATAPDALNLDNVRTEQNIWKALVKGGAKVFVKNLMFKEILDMATDSGEKELTDWMSTTRPVFPRFLSMIYSATIYGAMAKVIGRFGNNKTLVYAAGSDSVKESLSTIRLSHNLQWQNLKKMYKTIQAQTSYPLKLVCLTKLAQELRDKSWQVEGVDEGIYGSTVPHPFEQIRLYENIEGRCFPEEECYGTPYVFFQLHAAEQSGDRHLQRGMSEPYLSGRIRAKREQGVVHTTVLDSPIIAAAQLASNRSSVCDPDTSMDKTILNIIKSRTDIPPSIVESLIGKVYGGTLWHRLPDQYTSHEVSLNCRPNISTHVYISTDTMVKYSRGMRDYTLPYQSIFVAVNSLLSDASARGKLPAGQIVLHAHLHCIQCTREIDPIKLKCEEEYKEKNVITTNPLVRSTTTTLPVSMRDLIQPPGQLLDTREQNENHRVSSIAYMILHRFHTNIQVAMRSLTPTRRYKTDIQLRMGDVLSANPAAIIRKVADYLIMTAPNLLTPDQYPNLDRLIASLVIFVNMSGHHIWQSLGQFATLPEFVNALYTQWPQEDPGMDYGKGGHHTYRFLNRLVIKSIKNLAQHETPYTKFKSLFLYAPDPHWLNLLHTAHHMMINLWLYSSPYSTEEYAQHLIGMPQNPSEESVFDRVQSCLLDERFHPILDVLQNHSPNIRKSTAESDSRCREVEYSIIDTPRTQDISPSMPSSLPGKLKLGLVNCDFSHITTTVDHPPNPRIELKTRKDHEFKLVGNSSTAMYKWICALHHMRLQGTLCMTLGEGAGGLAKGLLEVFHCDQIVFNTLIDSREFDPHRVTSYLPSELRDWQDRIHELQFCCEHGGDLLQESTVTRYSRWKKVSLVTCDAEVNVDNIPNRLKLVDNVVRIAYSCLIPKGRLVIKSFVQNIQHLADELKLIARAFQCVRVFYTVESSYENYEVFIEAWNKIDDPKIRHPSINTIANLYQMSLTRLKETPIQSDYPLMHANIEKLLSYKTPNLTYSLSVFSNNLIDPEQWNAAYIDLIQLEIVYSAEKRVRTYKNLLKSSVSHTGDTAAVGSVVSEERYLNMLSVWYINLEILKGLIICKSAEPWEYRYRSYSPTSVYFLIRQSELKDYEQRYARHFYHLLGHAKRLFT
ncbi:MAG: RNA-dependent RNA polymerase [brine shrimp arlivirus 3]|nr:MAG: RNA-dependent RNA polymerase [brine shrimp arlivirus 3]